MSVTYYCDHCGQPCPASLRPEWYAFSVRLPKATVNGHICETCSDELLEWLGSPLRYTPGGVRGGKQP